MPDRKPRTDDTNQFHPAGRSCSQLRELAAQRAAARRGISRRDFVTAGAATAIAAATVRDSFAETPREAFDLCIARMKEGAKELSFDTEVLQALETHGLPVFEEHKGKWPGAKPRVLAASYAIGEISAALARLNNPSSTKTIRYPQAKDAVEVVKRNCTVHWKVEPRGVFCPDLP